MAEDLNIKLLIEAEDRSRDVFERQKQHTQQLIQQQKDLWTVIKQSDEAEVAGNKEKTLSAERYFATRKKAGGLAEEINKSYRAEEAALSDLSKTHDAHAKAVEAANAKKTKSFGVVGEAITHYVKHFASMTAIEEIIRHSTIEVAKFERGMNRIGLESGASVKDLDKFAHTIEALARLTGSSAGEIQESFRRFRDQSTASFGDTVKLFEQVSIAAHAAGASTDAVGKIALTTMKDLRVPIGQMSGVLDDLVKTVPASMMGEWAQVAPALTGMMRDLGFTGEASAKRLQSSFANLAKEFGSVGRAAAVYNNVMGKASDVSTNLGKMMLPMLQNIRDAGGTTEEVMIKMYDRLVKMGADDPDLARRSMVQKMLGVTDADIEGLRIVSAHARTLQEIAAKTGELVDEVGKRISALKGDPQAALDIVKASFDEILVSSGRILVAGGWPQALAQLMSSTATDMERIQSISKWLMDNVPGLKAPGYREPGAPPGVLPKQTTQGQMFGGPGEFLGYTGQTKFELLRRGFIGRMLGATDDRPIGPDAPPGLIEKNERERLEREIAAKKKLQDEVEAARLRREEEQRQNDERRNRLREPRRYPESRANPRGYAEGGQFKVGGQGGRDTEPVSFMATRGERVAITTEKDDSLQVQQDKADIAAREHFARFHGTAFTKTAAAEWWPSREARGYGELPTGTGGGAGSMPMGPRAGGPPGAPRGPRGPSGAPTAGDTTPAIPFSGGMSALSEQGFIHPVIGGKILSQHGDSRDGGRRVHRGIDINAPIGTTIQATTGGQKVTHAGWLGTNYGWGVKTIDEHGREHVYAHMHTNPAVSHGLVPGQVVGQGGAIGHVGKSGNARTTPPHLHYEVRPRVGAYNQSHNPTAFLPGFTGPGGIAVASPNTPGTPPAAATTQPGVPTAPGDARVTSGTATPAQIYQEFRRLAQAAGSPDPDLTASLAMLESGAGTTKNSVYERSGRTNPFGQTGPGPGGSVVGRDGQQHKVYKSLEQAFEDHLRGTHGARRGQGWADAYVAGDPQKTLQNLRRMGYNNVNPAWLRSVMAQAEKYKRAVPPLAAPANRPANSPTNTQLPPARTAGTVTTPTPPPPPAPGRQWGGLTRAGRPYVVGEGGPEVFVPNQPGSVDPSYSEHEHADVPHGYGPGTGLPGKGGIEHALREVAPGQLPDPDASEGWQDRERYGRSYRPGHRFDGRTGEPIGQDVNYMLSQHRALVSELSQPIRPQIEMPRSGPIRQRMSRHIEAQRERDVGRMTRYAAHSDIGFA